MNRITVAENAGFCYGVSRAVKLAEEAAPCYTLGPIINNRFAVESLCKKGVNVITDPAELPTGALLVIRSHGASKSFYSEFENAGIKYIDATCPYVAKTHEFAKNEYENGREVLIFGDKNHPEVQATAGWCDSGVIFGNEAELENLIASGWISKDKPYSVLSQTTARRDIWEKCISILKKLCTNVKILDTICNATNMRQAEAHRLSLRVDAMVIVGDPSSANTQGLTRSCACKAFQIESAFELDKLPLCDYDHIGVTAGASTPSTIIEEVISKMNEDLKINDVSEEESFAELFEQTLKPLNTGDKITGVVTALLPNEIQVDLGTKHAAYIPLDELTDDPNVKPGDLLKIGDEIETFVVRVNDVEGVVMLSKRRLDVVKSWDDVEAARESKTVVEGIVVEENKGGVVVSVKGVRVFVPASQTGLPKDAPMSSLIKKKVRLYVTEFQKARRRVVGSIRAVTQDERRLASENIWANVEPGMEYDGVVKSLTSYGVFVDIGGVDGLVHMSELSWNRVKNPADVVSVGDKLHVRVISVDKENKKISLSHRSPDGNPWNRFLNEYKVGDVVTVRIVKSMQFGAFAEIIPGVDGLIHISQLSDRRNAKTTDVVKEGDEVQVKITDINLDRKKVSLSIRALIEGGMDLPEEPDNGPDEIVAISGEGETLVSEGLVPEEDN